MIGKYHTSITNEALGTSFNGYAVNYIEKGNIDSDELRDYKEGITDGYDLSAQHFNKTSLEKCDEFFEDAQDVVLEDFIEAAKADGAEEDELYEQAFYDLGRLVHNIQDFYSHTNWINLNQDELWNEDIDNPNVDDPEKFKTGDYSYFSQFLDQINPFYKLYLSANYDALYEDDSSISHYGINKDKPGTIADELYEDKYGISGFTLASDMAREHTAQKWDEIDSVLKESLSEEEYENLKQKMSEFDSTQEDFDENLDELRANFNEDMKELQ